jgi:hypothetical protein
VAFLVSGHIRGAAFVVSGLIRGAAFLIRPLTTKAAPLIRPLTTKAAPLIWPLTTTSNTDKHCTVVSQILYLKKEEENKLIKKFVLLPASARY